MKINPVVIREIITAFNGQAIVTDDRFSRVALPGEYFLAFAPGTNQVLPVALFLYEFEKDSLTLCGNLPVEWQPGTMLNLQGPMGNGFQIPAPATKIAFLAIDHFLSERLIALMRQCITRGLAAVWVTEGPPPPLPPQVEILPLTDLVDAVNWSDTSVTAVTRQRLSTLLRTFDQQVELKDRVQVLIDSPFICGNSRCGVCAVNTSKGWRLACKDGPIFNLAEVTGD